MEKTIYLAGGCYWGVQKYVDNIRGVLSTDVGFANGFVVAPSYDTVKHTETGHAETVRVTYDSDVCPLPGLLRLFFRIIDPFTIDQQGHDIGHQYRTGVYWCDAADEPIVREELARLAQPGKTLAVEAQPLDCFYTAEEYHQKYLDKNPGGYCHVSWDAIDAVKAEDPKQV